MDASKQYNSFRPASTAGTCTTAAVPPSIVSSSASITATAFNLNRQQQQQQQQQHQHHQQQQRLTPSNLMQCMDREGNIDAFRYIEYSKQRRVDFLKRANFICKMKSSLQQQRALSLPGVSMTTMKTMSLLPTTTLTDLSMMKTATTTTGTNTGTNTNTNTNTIGTNNVAFWETMKNLSRRNESSLNLVSGGGGGGGVSFTTDNVPTNTIINHNRAIISRSSSMPLVSNITLSMMLAANNNDNNNGNPTCDDVDVDVDVDATVTTTEPKTKRRRLRREEFEAAEALLFSMGRDIVSNSVGNGSGSNGGGSSFAAKTDRRNDSSSSSSSSLCEEREK
jgi:hypothetical protein